MTGPHGPEGPTGPPPVWEEEAAFGEPIALDFGYTREELAGLLVGIADQLILSLQARADHLARDPRTAIEVEIRYQMAEAAIVGRFDEVQRLHELRLQALSVASQFQRPPTSS